MEWQSPSQETLVAKQERLLPIGSTVLNTKKRLDRCFMLSNSKTKKRYRQESVRALVKCKSNRQESVRALVKCNCLHQLTFICETNAIF